jgi:hypothetical protein
MSFQKLIDSVKNIPYGRNSNREDFSLVISENKGTCSSKHAFLKDFAIKNNIKNVSLFIGIYKMNDQNTAIGSTLSAHNLDYIPEAHCYLKIDGTVVDITSKESDFEKLKNDILVEIEIEPNQVSEFKIQYHQDFIRKWIINNNINYNFDEIWEIREKCIEQLSI